MKFAPEYADESDDARLYWKRKALIEFEKQAKGHGVAPIIQDHAQRQVLIVRAEIEALEGPPLRVIDGGAS